MRQRKKYSAARAFFIFIAIISVLALWSIVLGGNARSSPGRSRRLGRRGMAIDDRVFPQSTNGSHNVADLDVRLSLRRYRIESILICCQCILVHTVHDKCTFIQQNCPDEEAGLFSYLQLYYCTLHHAKPVAFTILTLWLGLLFSTIGIAASDFFCVNLSTISNVLGMSESMAGVTFLAFGNGSPDVFSTLAAMKTHSGSLAIGELIGAAGFITAVVAGSMALARPFKVARRSFLRDIGFFIVAASFSMVFLADGHLYLWECGVMVAFYIFYVITVFVWHWYRSRRRRSKNREAAARGNFQVPGLEEAEVEIYVDDEGDGITGGQRTPLRAPSAEDFANLERGGSPMPNSEREDNDENSHWMAEISSNMRVSRPRPGERRNTINPIRPSLVGALEFRAVLSSLQKARNIHNIPISLRRYSDDPTQQQDQSSTISNPEIHYEPSEDLDVTSSSALRPGLGPERNTRNRGRAASENGAALGRDPNSSQNLTVPDIDRLAVTPSAPALRSSRAIAGASGLPENSSRISAPRWSASPTEGVFGYRATSPAPLSPRERRHSADLLALPDGSVIGSPILRHSESTSHDDRSEYLETLPESRVSSIVPRIKLPQPPGTQGSAPASPFPEYHDDPDFISRSRAPSLRLPPPSVSSDSGFRQDGFHGSQPRLVRWWPYGFLPAPQILVSTLFPTLYSWHDKNMWEKLLGIVAAPTVLLLVLTLPVVESEKEDELLALEPALLGPDHPRSRRQSTTINQLTVNSPLYTDAEPERASSSTAITLNGADGVHSGIKLHPESQEPLDSHSSSPKDWNRWLLSTQLFTGPFFIVFIYWGNTDQESSGRALLLLMLGALLVSLGSFAILLLTTTPTRPPRYRYLFCFLGFVVSIAWISTIANEVVGVLKAFGVILDISDAILGLTVFAVGNSLGDLVANITVARLGFPVMALSACFGGPMLNILLGIGVSGIYVTIKSGQGAHHRHPDRPMKYKPYQIDVGGTLIISGVTLLVTLLGLLIVVPLNGWKMDRKIGWGLIALWSASTIGNVVVEVLGWDSKIR